jgi:hypothetical protein
MNFLLEYSFDHLIRAREQHGRHSSSKGPEGILDIEHSRWPGILIDNRNMQKAALFHDRQDILQHIAWVAV